LRPDGLQLYRAGKVGAINLRASEICAIEICAFEIGISEVRISGGGAKECRILEVRPGNIGASEL
jgi:hypothetical protein